LYQEIEKLKFLILRFCVQKKRSSRRTLNYKALQLFLKILFYQELTLFTKILIILHLFPCLRSKITGGVFYLEKISLNYYHYLLPHNKACTQKFRNKFCDIIVEYESTPRKELKSVASFCHQVAAGVQDLCYNFYFVKHYRVAKNSVTAKVRKK
jgi:hypothetical protein